jgi:spore germination protein KA
LAIIQEKNDKGIIMGDWYKILSYMLRFNRRKSANAEQPNIIPQTQTLLSEELNINLRMLQNIYADCSDVIFHDFLIGNQTKAVLIYIDGLAQAEEIGQHVLAPLQQNFVPEHTIPNIRQKIAVSSIQHVQTVADVIEKISGGNTILLMDRENQGLAIGVSKWEKRAIEEPIAESVLRGPREGFIESLRTNTSMLRRKLKSPNLKIKSMNIGKYSRTPVAIAYIEGIADSTLIEEMTNRLQRIELDGILGSASIEELIEDNPYSPFPQLLSTERPDVASAYLLEGHVVVLVDGTPSALIAPVTFFSLLQSPDDYSERYFVGTAIRWLRYLFLAVSLLGPSLYVAIVSFHQEMLPTTLLLTMAKSREQVPFPALVEAMFMETIFEAMREAGARLPKQVGSAVSIVGALVIGQAAIASGIASSPMVMVVAITGIASFMAPRFTVGIAVRLLRFPMMVLAGFLGLLGLILGVILILNHLLQLRSFGVPYMSPLAPLKGSDLKDVIIRAPRWALNTRPHLSGEWNQYRQARGLRPDPTKGDEEG